MPTFPLTQSGRAIANSAGKAVINIGPDRAYEKWHITSVAVQSSSSTLVPEVREYRQSEAESNLIGTTRSGDLDSGSSDVTLQPGEHIIYVFTGADVGSTCEVTVNGTRTLP